MRPVFVYARGFAPLFLIHVVWFLPALSPSSAVWVWKSLFSDSFQDSFLDLKGFFGGGFVNGHVVEKRLLRGKPRAAKLGLCFYARIENESMESSTNTGHCASR